MRNWRPSRLLTLLTMAVVGYAAAFASAGAGAIFALLLAIGVVGEVGVWAELISRWRSDAGN